MRSDQEIKQDIIDRLRTDARINSSDITVTVDSGIATLEGKVLTYPDKLTAADIARDVIGVISVINNIDVFFDPLFTVPTDEEIRESIENLLALNIQIDGDKVSVDVSGGAVTLGGTVPSLWQKFLAEDEATNAAGVITVVNKIAVVPTEKLSDEILGKKVMDRIEQSSPLYVDEIDTKVKNGTVSLSGEVPNYNVWLSIYDAARNTFGVTEVQDNMEVVYIG